MRDGTRSSGSRYFFEYLKTMFEGSLGLENKCPLSRDARKCPPPQFCEQQVYAIFLVSKKNVPLFLVMSASESPAIGPSSPSLPPAPHSLEWTPSRRGLTKPKTHRTGKALFGHFRGRTVRLADEYLCPPESAGSVDSSVQEFPPGKTHNSRENVPTISLHPTLSCPPLDNIEYII